MATTLTLKIGTLTASATAEDANAQRILEACFALYHRGDAKPYTPQQKLDWVVKALIPALLVDKVHQWDERDAVRVAQETVSASAAKFE